MQWYSSAVVLLSALALGPRHAAAQTAPPTAAGQGSSKPAAKPATPNPASPPPADGNSTRRPDEQLGDEAELARIVGLYEAGKYRECSSELERLLDPLNKTPLKKPAVVETARIYWAACLMGAGETEAADAPLRAAIHENVQMNPPDSYVFPQPLVKRFLWVRETLVNEIRENDRKRFLAAQAEARAREEKLARDRARMAALEKLARQQVVVVRNRRSLAFIPFGVGQIQNRQETLGFTLMGTELVLGGLSLAAIAVQSRLANGADELRKSGKTVDEGQQRDLQSAWSTVKTTSAWAFVAVAVGGVLHAQLEFVPEFREVKQRQLPPGLSSGVFPKLTEVSAVPYFDAEQRSGGLSVSGHF
jgi:hypothetical protein